jgi:hypothetical protein
MRVVLGPVQVVTYILLLAEPRITTTLLHHMGQRLLEEVVVPEVMVALWGMVPDTVVLVVLVGVGEQLEILAGLVVAQIKVFLREVAVQPVELFLLLLVL